MWSYFVAVASFPATIYRARPALGAPFLIIATVTRRGGLRRVGFPSCGLRPWVGWLGGIYAGFADSAMSRDLAAILVEIVKRLASPASVADLIHNVALRLEKLSRNDSRARQQIGPLK